MSEEVVMSGWWRGWCGGEVFGGVEEDCSTVK